jgi:hypothetical protein
LSAPMAGHYRPAVSRDHGYEPVDLLEYAIRRIASGVPAAIPPVPRRNPGLGPPTRAAPGPGNAKTAPARRPMLFIWWSWQRPT